MSAITAVCQTLPKGRKNTLIQSSMALLHLGSFAFAVEERPPGKGVPGSGQL
jgi:hypothetical protein